MVREGSQPQPKETVKTDLHPKKKFDRKENRRSQGRWKGFSWKKHLILNWREIWGPGKDQKPFKNPAGTLHCTFYFAKRKKNWWDALKRGEKLRALLNYGRRGLYRNALLPTVRAYVRNITVAVWIGRFSMIGGGRGTHGVKGTNNLLPGWAILNKNSSWVGQG